MSEEPKTNSNQEQNKKPQNAEESAKKADVMLSVPNKTNKAIKMTPLSTTGVNDDKAKTDKKLAPKTKKLIAIIAAAVLVIAAIIGGVVLATHNGDQKQGDDVAIVEPEPEPEPDPEPLENKDPLTPEPGEVDPANYHVAAYKPRFLSIPSLGLTNIPVTEVGWVNGNQLGSPVSTRVAGWFYRSSIPGELGPAVINAHGGDLGTGIFKTLPKIKDGDEIIIEMGDGRKFTYIVGEIAFKALGAEANEYMNKAFQSLVPGKPSLTLITCTGNWLKNQQTYDKRLYVRASMK